MAFPGITVQFKATEDVVSAPFPHTSCNQPPCKISTLLSRFLLLRLSLHFHLWVVPSLMVHYLHFLFSLSCSTPLKRLMPFLMPVSPSPPPSRPVIYGMQLHSFQFQSKAWDFTVPDTPPPPESPHSSSFGDSPPSPSSIVVGECSFPIPRNHSGWCYPSALTSTPISHEGDNTLWPLFCGLHISGGTSPDEPLLHVQCSCCQAWLYVPFAKDLVTCIFCGLSVGLFQNPVCHFHWESWHCWWGQFVGINQSSHWYSGFSQSGLSKFQWGQGGVSRCPECGKGSDVAIN